MQLELYEQITAISAALNEQVKATMPKYGLCDYHWIVTVPERNLSIRIGIWDTEKFGMLASASVTEYKQNGETLQHNSLGGFNVNLDMIPSAYQSMLEKLLVKDNANYKCIYEFHLMCSRNGG